MAKGACDCDDPNCADNLDMDMLMDPCCAKDMKDSRRAAGLMSRLRDYDPARRALDERRGVIDAAPLFYARNLGSRGCPPLYRIVLEHCLGWSVLAFVLALMSSHGRLWRERFDLMRARARGLAPVGSAAVADD